MKRTTGRLGQFDVLADGELIASRTSGSWPQPAAVIAELEARLAKHD